MQTITQKITLLLISTLTINCSFAQWSEDANNIWGTDSRKAIGMGTATPQSKLDVRGIITAGDNPSTNGSTILQGLYGSGALNNLGGVYSSGGSYLSYGANQNGSNTWLSTSSIPMTRSIAVLDDAFRVYTAPAQTVPIGSTLTTQPTEVFTIANNGNITVKGLIRIPMASAIDNQSPGITPWPGDDFKYNGEYLNHYGLGFHLYEFDNGSPKGTNAYLSGYYGVNFFTGGCNRLRINYDGNVGIGTTTPTEKLSVNGNIKAKKLIVTQTGWADYVFDKAYTLMPVDSLSTYINTHKHLPEIPTTKDVQDHGVDVGNNQALLLKKIEELTLYIIQQNERIKKLENAQISNVRMTNVPMITKQIN